MVQRSFAELVTDLKTRRTLTEKAPVLLLGAGASVGAGVGAMPKVIKFFGCTDFKEFTRYIKTVTPDERYRYLAKFLQAEPEAKVTPGHQALATMCGDKWFDLVLTTNLDPLLEDALSAARLRRRDYLLLVNGMIRLDDRLGRLLSGQSPRVKIVKLHGDLFQRVMAWTETEMDTYLTEIAPYLQPEVADRDFLVVGYSLRDRRVRELVESTSGSVWFTHPEAVPDHLRRATDMRFVIDPKCESKTFFPELAEALHVAEPLGPLDTTIARGRFPGPIGITARELSSAGPADAGAQTMDDVTSATLAVQGPAGTVSTAFLLDEPRVIICDRYSSDAHSVDDAVRVIDTTGNRFSARILASNVNHPFGPTVLNAPAELRMPGLRLNPFPLWVDEEVQVLVAAGANTGISSGKVTASEISSRIEPIDGEVGDLVELECFTAPGSSGAPVVDSSLSVRGFIVAGSMDPENPRSFAYPAQHWASILEGL